jgi:hypothetical protein
LINSTGKDRPTTGGEGQISPLTQRTTSEISVVFPLVVVYCISLIVLLGIYPVFSILSHVSNDFGEGWSAYWTRNVQTGAPLYSASRVFTANNYPPLSFYLNAFVGDIVGDNIVAGRIVALASMVGVAGLIARIVSVLGGPARWALLSAAIFLLYNLVYLRQMVAIDNPQWLGELIGLTSVLPLIGRPPSELRPRQIIGAAGLMVAAGLVKHNQFALPIAISTWLLLWNRRAFAVWCLAGLTFIAVACLVLFEAYGTAVFVEILHYKRTISLPTFRSGLSKTGSFATLIGVALLSLRWQRKDARVLLLLLYAAFGVLFGMLQRLGSGVYINAYDDAIIALAAVCGCLLGLGAAGLHQKPLGPWSRMAMLLVILLPIVIVTPKNIKRSIAETRDIPHQQAIWTAMIADVRGAPDPVICEMLAVCYWAGKPLEVDFFAYGQKLRTGTSASRLTTMIAARKAAVLVLDRTEDVLPSEKRLPPPLPALIEANYGVTRIASNGTATMHRLAK